MCTWVYETRLRDPSSGDAQNGLYLAMKFAVYADMSNASANPYVRLTNCDLFSRTKSVVSSRVAATIKIQINGTGTTYTFNTGSSVQQIGILEYNIPEGGEAPYSTRFSSNTNIPINKTRTPFTFNMTLTTRNGETYTRAYPACGLLPETVSGPTSINTGRVSTYTFSSPVRNEYVDGEIRFNVAAWLGYAETTANYADGTTETYPEWEQDAYIGPYETVLLSRDNVSAVSFVPRNYSTASNYSNVHISNGGYVCLDYYYVPPNTGTSIGYYELVSYTIVYTGYKSDRYKYSTDTGILVSHVRKRVTVNNRTTVDAGLRPEFKNFSHSAYPPEGSNVYQSYSNIFDTMLEKYGGVVQGARNAVVIAHFYADENYISYRAGRPSGEALKYGDRFISGSITENFGSTTRTTTMESDMRTSYDTSIGYIKARCSVSGFEIAGANKRVTFSLRDEFGFTTTVSDTITVLPYHRPALSVYRARRCRIAAAGDTETYTYDGVSYTPDEDGEYALIEWQLDISALNNMNSRVLRIRMTGSEQWQNLDVNSYTDSGFVVKPALPDQSYSIQFSVSDDFYTDVIFIAPLNTVYAMLDFKRDGNGVAMGKVSELDYVYDIHRNWKLRMPYNTYVQNYNSNGTSVNLYDWMQSVDQRIETIINNRDVGIFADHAVSGSSRWYEGNSSACVPTSYCTIDGENKLNITSGGQTFRTGGWMNKNAITLNRKYLNIRLGQVYSYSGNTSTSQIVYRPTVYICSSKPTSFNQSTGAPNTTILRQQTYNMQETSFNGYYSVDGYDVGYYTWHSRYPGDYITNEYSINVSAYQGRNVWIVVTATCGYCPVPSDTPSAVWDSYERDLTMSSAYIEVDEIWLSNKTV